MIAELGRRYLLFVGTPRGKQIVLALIFGLAIVIELIASTLTASGNNSRGAAALSSLAAGFAFAGVYLVLMNRRPT